MVAFRSNHLLSAMLLLNDPSQVCQVYQSYPHDVFPKVIKKEEELQEND